MRGDCLQESLSGTGLIWSMKLIPKDYASREQQRAAQDLRKMPTFSLSGYRRGSSLIDLPLPPAFLCSSSLQIYPFDLFYLLALLQLYILYNIYILYIIYRNSNSAFSSSGVKTKQVLHQPFALEILVRSYHNSTTPAEIHTAGTVTIFCLQVFAEQSQWLTETYDLENPR